MGTALEALHVKAEALSQNTENHSQTQCSSYTCLNDPLELKQPGTERAELEVADWMAAEAGRKWCVRALCQESEQGGRGQSGVELAKQHATAAGLVV